MIFFPNTASENSDAKYFLAQYHKDPLRQEPRNVGVVVTKGNEVVARFRAEDEPGKWNTSLLRPFRNSNVYRLWVDSWRDTLEKQSSEISVANLESGSNFRVIEGGEVSSSEDESAHAICNFLYHSLVSEGGVVDAEQEQEAEKESHNLVLKNDVTAELRKLNLLGSNRKIQNPIQRDTRVPGKASFHKMPYFQTYKEDVWAIDVVDFHKKRIRQSVEHAAYVKLAFADISEHYGPRFHPITILRCGDEIRNDESVKTGMGFVESSKCEIVDWTSKKEKTKFLTGREKIANSV